MQQDMFGETQTPDEQQADLGPNVPVHAEVFIGQLQAKFSQLLTNVVTENAELRAALQTQHGDLQAALAKADALQQILDELRAPTLPGT